MKASVELVAAESDRARRLSITAYTGQPFSPPGWPNTLVAVDGVTHADSVPILLDHESSVRSTLGAGRVSREDGQIIIDATLAKVDAANTAIELLNAGVRLEASIGLRNIKHRRVRENESISANGSVFSADAVETLISSAELYEVSLVPIGADRNTSVSISAKDSNMPDQIQEDRSQAADEVRRVSGLQALAADNPKHGDLIAKAIEDGDTLQATELAILRADLSTAPKSTTPGGGSTATKDTLAAAMMVRAGFETYAEKAFGEQTMEASKDFHQCSLVDFARESMLADGLQPPRDKTELLRASFGTSTGSMPVAFSNALGKTVWESYNDAPTTWRMFSSIASAADFKEQTGVMPNYQSPFLPLNPTGEIQAGDYDEQFFTWKATTKARRYMFGREQFMNDDLGVLNRVSEDLGRNGARALNDHVWTLVFGNLDSHGNPFFDAANNNLLEAASALSLDTLDTAITAMLNQTYQGENIDMRPASLIVSPNERVNAQSILNSIEIRDNEANVRYATGNGLQNSLALGVEPRIANTAKYGSVTDPANWYVFASPSAKPVVVGFVDGKQVPSIEYIPQLADATTLTWGWAAWFDFGASLVDPLAAQKATGAA